MVKGDFAVFIGENYSGDDCHYEDFKDLKCLEIYQSDERMLGDIEFILDKKQRHIQAHVEDQDCKDFVSPFKDLNLRTMILLINMKLDKTKFEQRKRERRIDHLDYAGQAEAE